MFAPVNHHIFDDVVHEGVKQFFVIDVWLTKTIHFLARQYSCTTLPDVHQVLLSTCSTSPVGRVMPNKTFLGFIHFCHLIDTDPKGRVTDPKDSVPPLVSQDGRDVADLLLVRYHNRIPIPASWQLYHCLLRAIVIDSLQLPLPTQDFPFRTRCFPRISTEIHHTFATLLFGFTRVLNTFTQSICTIHSETVVLLSPGFGWFRWRITSQPKVKMHQSQTKTVPTMSTITLLRVIPHFKSYILTFYLTFYLTSILIFYLAYRPAFYLVYILAFYLAYILAFYVAFFLAYILAFYVAFYVAYILAVYLAYILAVFLAYILAFHLAAEVQWCPLSSEGPRLKSSGARWARKVPGWGPAVHTALRTLRLRSSRAHSDRKPAVEVQQCPLRAEVGEEIGEGLASRQRWWRRRRRTRRRWRRRRSRNSCDKI